MKFLVMIYGNDASLDGRSRAEYDRMMAVHRAVQDELVASGELIETSELSTTQARVVRRKDGVAVVTDGPYAESKELLAGYYLLECASLDRATEIAGRLPEADLAPIEVRRVGPDDAGVAGPAPA
jgi:hypothetical protein